MELESPAYLLAYFRSGPRQTNKIEKLHYAYSRDGLHWYELNKNKAIWSSSIGEGILRDPFINKGNDGKWHMVYTIRPKGKAIGYANSYDLVTWENEKAVHVMSDYDKVQNSWAPEFNFDPKEKDYLLYWASSVGDKMNNNKHYYTRTKDWEHFSKTKLFFDPGYQTIDASITQWQDKNYMFVKDESFVYDRKNHQHPPANKLAISSNLEGPYDVASDFITPDYTEGPEILKLQDQKKWYLIYDYWQYGRFGIKESTDLVNWSEEFNSNEYRFPHQARHATVFPLHESELMTLVNHFSLEAHYYEPFHHYVALADKSGSGFLHDEFTMRSVSMMVKANKTDGIQVLYDEGGDKSGLAIRIKDGQIQAAIRNDGIQKNISSHNLERNNWHHVVVVFNEGVFTLYLDSVLQDRLEFDYELVESHYNPGGLGARFGVDAFGNKNGKAIFNGVIKDVRIYNIPLQNSDVNYIARTSKK